MQGVPFAVTGSAEVSVTGGVRWPFDGSSVLVHYPTWVDPSHSHWRRLEAESIQTRPKCSISSMAMYMSILGPACNGCAGPSTKIGPPGTDIFS